MIEVIPAASRGKTAFPGLDSYHSFSFGEYYDENRMQFRALRVINDDLLAPGFGFPLHPHRNMEIVTYVTGGVIEHQDSMGNKAHIEAGELQRMTAGSGVRHSEYNASKSAPASLLQIWILPAESGLTPGYEQKKINQATHGLTLAVSPKKEDGTLFIHQDASVYIGRLRAGEALVLPLEANRYGWIQLINGKLTIERHSMAPGDGARIEEMVNPEVKAVSDAHFLFFNLA